jgi:ubiquinone biosynthesis protein UbiJ
VAFVFSMIAFEALAARALNHLLEDEAWARERLAPFAGETIELRAELAPTLRLSVAADGRLRPAAAEASPALVMTFGPQILPALARGEDHLMRAIDTRGDSRLANELLFLFRHLRWDAEEDLARFLGDAAAHRLVSTVRQLASWNREALERMSANVMEHALEEKRVLARRSAFEEHRSDVARLRDALERLEKRVGRFAS